MDSAWAWCMAYYHACPPRPRGAGGGRWHMVLRRVQRQMRVPHFFPCLTTHARPPRGPEGWMAHGATESTEASASASLPAPPPSRPGPLTPHPPPTSRLPPPACSPVPSRSPAPGAPAPALSFFCLAKLPPAWGRDEAYGECRGTWCTWHNSSLAPLIGASHWVRKKKYLIWFWLFIIFAYI